MALPLKYAIPDEFDVSSQIDLPKRGWYKLGQTERSNLECSAPLTHQLILTDFPLLLKEEALSGQLVEGEVWYYRLSMAYQFSRKGCFKCGNLGHIAENCSSEQRLCYNCRQPGHESSACPSPRTVSAKQCYSCGGVGHIQGTLFLYLCRSYCSIGFSS
ncbi:hypothetical protein L218DRAFT_660340 [Marasmius fiardii PR-910]|nr:hypothetical protein L218DRAFT_660340 [Marasmius fiardii PR-910]